jgi:hypothetical protein
VSSRAIAAADVSGSVDSHAMHNVSVFDETVVQSAEIEHGYIATDDGEYETQIVEYDADAVDGVAGGIAAELTVGEPATAVDMECHETLDAETGAPASGHVVVALGEGQMIYPTNQVVYMYADCAGTEIEDMDDMVEIETVESAVDVQLHESCDQVSMDHVEEDSETCHELVLVDGCQTGIIIEQLTAECEQSETEPSEVQVEFLTVEGDDIESVADDVAVPHDQLIAPVECISLSTVEQMGLAGLAVDGSNVMRSVTGVSNVVTASAVAEYTSAEDAIYCYEDASGAPLYAETSDVDGE